MYIVQFPTTFKSPTFHSMSQWHSGKYSKVEFLRSIKQKYGPFWIILVQATAASPAVLIFSLERDYFAMIKAKHLPFVKLRALKLVYESFHQYPPICSVGIFKKFLIIWDLQGFMTNWLYNSKDEMKYHHYDFISKSHIT